jgi:hypothetical protein
VDGKYLFRIQCSEIEAERIGEIPKKKEGED